MTTMTTPPAQDQAAQLRKMVASTSIEAKPAARAELKPAPLPTADTARPTAPVIAIASGKGGVGKTNIAVALSSGLVRRGRKVALIDADLGVANADVLCGLRTTAHLGEVIAGERTIMDIAEATNGGFLLIPGGSGIASLADLNETQRETLFAQLSHLDSKCNAMLIDCGAGIGRSVRRLVQAADLSIIVTTPEPTAIADAYSLIKCVVTEARETGQSHHARIAIAVNQVNDIAEAHRVHTRIAGVCKKFLGFEPGLAGAIRYDRVVLQAVRARKPFMQVGPKSNAARDVHALATFIDGALPRATTGRFGFVRRLAGRIVKLGQKSK